MMRTMAVIDRPCHLLYMGIIVSQLEINVQNSRPFVWKGCALK